LAVMAKKGLPLARGAVKSRIKLAYGKPVHRLGERA